MTPQSLTPEFANTSKTEKPKRKRIAPLSVRVSKEQRAELEERALGTSLNAYVLSCLFDNPKRKRKRRKATKCDKALARALSRLGHSGIIVYLVSQIVALEEGRLHLSDHEEKELRKAYADIYLIRNELLEAAGLAGDL